MPQETLTFDPFGDSFTVPFPDGIPVVKKNGGSVKKQQQKKPVVQDATPLVPMKGFTFGADPELFVCDPEGRIVCADMIPGTKSEPHKVEYGAIQRDGFAAEYNIDPASTFEEWNRNHKAVQGQLRKFLPTGFKLVAVASHCFDRAVFDSAPDEAKELGCQPDWNAWTASLNPPPRLPDEPTLRCTGGHIHVGWTEDAESSDIQHMMNCFDLTKQLDYFLGAWSLLHDNDNQRRRLYGRAGACRLKPYGVEYRVLSSFWTLDKSLRLEVWNRMCKAVETMSKGYMPGNSSSLNEYLQVSINQGRLEPVLKSHANYPINTLIKVGG